MKIYSMEITFYEAEQVDWLEDTDEEVDEQELEAYYSFMAKIQEVLHADLGTDVEPLEKVVLKWIPIRKPVETHYTTNDSSSPLGKETDNPKIIICGNSSSLSAVTLLRNKCPLGKVKESIIVWEPQVVTEPCVLKLWFRRNSLEELFLNNKKVSLPKRKIWNLKVHKLVLLQSYPCSSRVNMRCGCLELSNTSRFIENGPVTTKEKVQKKNEVKARSMLLMALLNEHLMAFNQYKDAKTLFDTIETRFSGNKATKKIQNTLLKIKYDLDTMSIDDLYNNFKIVKQEVKGTACSDSSSQNIAFMTSPSTNSINEVRTTYRVSTASTQSSTTSTKVSTANLSDATVYAYLSNQSHGSQLVHEDLEQIHEDDVEEMDLKWKLALLSMREKGQPKDQDSKSWNQDRSKRTVNVEETPPKAMVAIDGVGFDWSYVAEDEVPTNMALMAFLDSEFNKSEFNVVTYKRGLAYVEEKLVFYKKNEVLFCEQIVVLKKDLSYRDSEISGLKCELEKLKKEKESNQLKIKKLNSSSKSLEKIIRSQISDNNKKGLGYVSFYVVLPPPTGLFSPKKIDFSYSGLEEFKQPEFHSYGPKSCETKSKNASKEIPNELKKYPDAPLVKDRVLDNKYCSVESPIVVEKKIVVPSVDNIAFVKAKQQEKPVRKQLTHLTVKRPYQQRTSFTNKSFRQPVNTARPRPINTARLRSVNTVRPRTVNTARLNSAVVNAVRGHPQQVQKNQGYVDNGCSRHMIGNMSYLLDFKEFNKGYVTFRGGVNGGRITGVKREFSVARTPHQNGVAERRNKTLIKATRTMLADSKLLTIFWAEAVNTACYVHNRVLVVKPHNKTPYELFRGRSPALSFMKPFGCHVTILNTLDNLGKFDGKADEGYFVRYSMHSKAFRVYNIRTRRVEENLHIEFLENKPIVVKSGPKWLFDTDMLIELMNYVPVIAGLNFNDFKDGSLFDSSSKNATNDEPQSSCDAGNKVDNGINQDSRIDAHEKSTNIINDVNTVRPSINVARTDVDTEGDMSNINTTHQVPSTLNTRIHKDHSLDLVIGDVQSGVMTRKMTKTIHEQGFSVVTKALTDPAWVDAMQEELLQFKLQKVLILVDFPKGFMVYQMDVKSTILYEKIEEVVYVCQPLRFEDHDHLENVYKVVKALYGLHQAPRAWYETLAKYLLGNRFHKGKIYQTLFIKRQNGDILLVQVYVDDIIFGSTKKELCNEFERLMKDRFHMSFIGELTFFLGLQVKKKKDGIFISQNKYVTEDLRKFNLSDAKTTNTLVDTKKPLVKDADGDDVDVHLYRFMIGSLMYLTASRPNIMYAVCVCARFQVTPKRHLKLEDSYGISTLPNTKIFEQLALMVYVSNSNKGPFLQGEGSTVLVESHHITSGAPTTSQPPLSSRSRIPTRQETEVPQPSSPTQTHVADEATSTEVAKVHTYTRRKKEISTASGGISTAAESVSTAGASMLVSNVGMVDKGKAIMQESEPEKPLQSCSKDKKELAMKQLSFNIDEYEDIQATIEADEELALRIQAEEREKYPEAKKARLLVDLRLSFDELKNLFEATMKRVNTFTLIESDVDRTIPKITNECSKRAAEEELEQESSKRQKTRDSLEPREKEDDELTQEDLQQMMMMVPVEEVYVEALQKFDRDRLIKLWDLVKERFSITEPTDDIKKELYVELKRLFEPDTKDELWKLQRHMHDPLT
uniref:Retrovirus-related Pol polyprotein from transposon TNT 1-94 n=1 Tax=Tanacetum cinerariifolium TaxID=118510 RepID=A0A6L2LGH5_TANCI|nr:retrovirus-related Pol polyprotein from transposon TNT 1-94 [Tanacetum cinerariifolium]